MRTVPLVGAVVLALALPSLGHAAPVNDDFANAIDLNAVVADDFVSGTNVGASKEMGEPDHGGNSGGRSVWYTWTAPGDGSIPNVGIRVFGDFDTLLGVYTGVAVGALTEEASNDDVPFGASAVSFATTPGTTYRIAVDGFAGKSGRFDLVWNEAPANDNFADAVVLAGAAGARMGDPVRGATLEPGEIDPFGTGQSVWYSWTPPADGTYKLSTFGSSFDTILAVYEGSSLETLTLLELNDDDPDRGCCSSWIPLVDADSATTYQIQVTPLGFPDFPEPMIALSWGPLVLGTGGADVLVGTAGAEEIRGRGGPDMLSGGGGDDLLFGGRGNDVSRGGSGDDLVFDRRGAFDILLGQGDEDRVDARDGRPGDTVRGGIGIDVCRSDPGDTRSGCP